MRKTKHQTHFLHHNFNHDDLTQKSMVRSPLAFRQRKLVGKSSALPTNRIRQKETNIFKPQKPSSPLSSPIKVKNVHTEQQIKSSNMYKLLEEQIIALIKRQESEFQKLEELRKAKEYEISQVKNHQHSIKLEIWQLRNETMELKDAIQTQTEENNRLMEELGVSEEDFQFQFQQPNNQGQYENNEKYYSSQND